MDLRAILSCIWCSEVNASAGAFVHHIGCPHPSPQDDLYKPDYYMPLLEFREVTLKRLQRFADERFFSVGHHSTASHLSVPPAWGWAWRSVDRFFDR